MQDPNPTNNFIQVPVYAPDEVWEVRYVPHFYGGWVVDFTNSAGHLLRGCPIDMFKDRYPQYWEQAEKKYEVAKKLPYSHWRLPH